jgi:hypothetical protein
LFRRRFRNGDHVEDERDEVGEEFFAQSVEHFEREARFMTRERATDVSVTRRASIADNSRCQRGDLLKVEYVPSSLCG